LLRSEECEDCPQICFGYGTDHYSGLPLVFHPFFGVVSASFVYQNSIIVTGQGFHTNAGGLVYRGILIADETAAQGLNVRGEGRYHCNPVPHVKQILLFICSDMNGIL